MFGATERPRMPAPDGKADHAETGIGGAAIMLADECPDLQFRGPKAFGGSPVALWSM